MSGFTIPNAPDAAVSDQAEPDSLDFQILGDRTNGVIHTSSNETALKVSPSSNTLQANVDVSPGELVINGAYYSSSSTVTVALTGYSGTPFFDIIVARTTGNPASPLTFVAIPGNTAPNPRFPSSGTASPSTQVNFDTDVVLAAVYRDTTSTTIAENKIIDKRAFVRSTVARLGGATPTGGNSGDLWVNTVWSPTTTITAANHTDSPLHVKVGNTWYNLASWQSDMAPAVGTAKTTGNRGENKIVLRDSSGNFYANIIYANTFDGNLSGNATTATTATTANSVAWANVSGVNGKVTDNRKGVYRLYRRDDNSDYSVQTYWTGARWRLYGYNGDTAHADTHVGYADSAGSAGNSNTLGGYGLSTLATGSTIVLRNTIGDVQGNDFYGSGQWSTFGYSGFRVDNYQTGGVYNKVVSNARTVLINSQGTIGTSASTIKVKKDIEPLTLSSNLILQIEPVSFKYKEEILDEGSSNPTQVGVIAEQVESLGTDMEPLLYRDENNEVNSFNYEKLSILLLKVCQDQQSAIDSLSTRIEALEAKKK